MAQLRLPKEPRGARASPHPQSGSTPSGYNHVRPHHSLDGQPPLPTREKPTPRDCKGYWR
ncbi:MAG: hypothetical protein ACTSUQ_13045 [Candidatus Freyarchaeota archaeon]